VNYTTVEELLGNDSFLAWYYQKDKREANEWDEWIRESQEYRRLANEAIRFLELVLMAKENVVITEQQMNTTFDRITNTIVTLEQQQ
jgi:transmembrane sensor